MWVSGAWLALLYSGSRMKYTRNWPKSSQTADPETGKVNASKHWTWGLFVIQHVLCKSWPIQNPLGGKTCLVAGFVLSDSVTSVDDLFSHDQPLTSARSAPSSVPPPQLPPTQWPQSPLLNSSHSVSWWTSVPLTPGYVAHDKQGQWFYNTDHKTDSEQRHCLPSFSPD